MISYLRSYEDLTRDDQGQTSLSMAISEQNECQIVSCLRRGEDPNTRMVWDMGPGWNTCSDVPILLVAVHLGHLEIVSHLLAAGAVTDPRGDYYEPPLVHAAYKNQRTILKRLLKAGADVNSTSMNGTSAVHWAARNNDIESLEELRKHGADLNLRNNTQFTPLQMAAWGNAGAAAKWLLEQGSDISAVNIHGRSVVQLAELKGHQQLAGFLKTYENKYYYG